MDHPGPDGVRPLDFPRSLVVVGASPRRPGIVASVLAGSIPAWGVHPTRRRPAPGRRGPGRAAARPRPEAFCGMTRDPHYGPVLAVGAGGTDAESLDRIAVCVAPVDTETAAALAVEAGVDRAREEIAATLVALGRLAVEHPQIAEIDVNPLILGDGGAVAVDALVVVDREAGA